MKALVNGIEIDYREAGRGEALVLLHAFPLGQAMWDEQVAAFAERFRVVTFDLRGFGASSAPEGPYTMERMADDVSALLGYLGIERAVIAGLSMGGYIALAFYRRHAELVRALVLADTRAGADSEAGREQRLKMAEKVEREGAEAIADEMIGKLLAPATVERRADIIDRLRRMIAANSPRGIAGAQRGMAERDDSSDLLPQIACPALVIVGADDQLTPVAEADRLRAGIPNARLEIIEGAGHLPNIEQPEAFNRALGRFLDSLP